MKTQEELLEEIDELRADVLIAKGWGVIKNYDTIFKVNELIDLYNSKLKWYNKKMRKL